jgi:hypothetical protein
LKEINALERKTDPAVRGGTLTLLSIARSIGGPSAMTKQRTGFGRGRDAASDRCNQAGFFAPYESGVATENLTVQQWGNSLARDNDAGRSVFAKSPTLRGLA